MEMTKSRKLGAILATACATAVIAFSAAVMTAPQDAEAANPPAAFARIGNYSTSGAFVQGGTVTADGKTAYVVKQKKGSYVNLQKVDLVKKQPTRLSLSKAGRSAIGHGNGVATARVYGKDYLLVAPGHGAHYVAVFSVSGKTASYKGKIPVSTSVVKVAQKIAVERVNGDKVTALIGKGSTMKRVTLDVSKRSRVKSGTNVRGFWSSLNQGISVSYENGAEYVYGVRNGWESEYGDVVKFRLSGNKLTHVYTKRIAGEPQTAVSVNGNLYTFVEGGTAWNKAHKCRFSDRIVRWNA